LLRPVKSPPRGLPNLDRGEIKFSLLPLILIIRMINIMLTHWRRLLHQCNLLRPVKSPPRGLLNLDGGEAEFGCVVGGGGDVEPPSREGDLEAISQDLSPELNTIREGGAGEVRSRERDLEAIS